MKKTYLSILASFITLLLFSQSPEGMSYQSVVRDADGDLIISSAIGVKISVLQDSIDGDVVYSETHAGLTNKNGLLSLVIGEGTSSDNFSTINWSGNSHFIKTEIDPDGGTSYSISGTSQLLSVPYALHAKTVAEIPSNYSEISIEDSINIGANGMSIMGITKVTGTTDAANQYVSINFPAGYTNSNSYVLSVQILTQPFINSSTIFGLGSVGTDGTVGYELTYLRTATFPFKTTRRIKINYPSELKGKPFSVVLMRYR